MVTPTGILPGSRIGGKYEVVEVIGYGGMGVVYKVREQVGAVSRIRALKTVLPRHATNAAIVSRFREEAEKMCLLEHENIVPVLSYSEEGEFPYLVMPFIEGQTLKEHLAAHMAKHGRPLPLSEVLEIGLQVTRGLEVAHRFTNPDTGKLQPIIHRDIKPGNIMVRVEGSGGERRVRVLIMDFGIAKLVSDEDSGHTLTDVIGTVKYASPEQVQRSKDIDPRADIYSLGMVLFELHCGRHVFSDLSEHGVLMRMMQRQLEEIVPQFPVETPPGFHDLIMRCLSVDREQRFADVSEMRTILRGLQETERARRNDDTREAEEVADTTRSAAVARGAEQFAPAAWTQAQRLADQAKAAKDKSLHTEATELFQAAATAFSQAADFASQAREREDAVARLAALRPLREEASAARAGEVAATAFAAATRATEAAERAIAANDLETANREITTAEGAWVRARDGAKRESARAEVAAGVEEVERALAAATRELDALPQGLHSLEAAKRLAEARTRVEAARAAAASAQPATATPELVAARAAIEAAAGARAAHLARIADERRERCTQGIRRLESALAGTSLEAERGPLAERLSEAEAAAADGQAVEAIRRLDELEREVARLTEEAKEEREAGALLERARGEATRAREEAEPFFEGGAPNDDFVRAGESWKKAEERADADSASAARDFEAAAEGFSRAKKRAEADLRERVRTLRQSAEDAERELRGLGERFVQSTDVRAALETIAGTASVSSLVELRAAIDRLTPLADAFRAWTDSARGELALEREQREATAVRDRAVAADRRIEALPAERAKHARLSAARDDLRAGLARFETKEWAAAVERLGRAAGVLETIHQEIDAAMVAERLAVVRRRLGTVNESLLRATPPTRALRRRHGAATQVADRAEVALDQGDEAAAVDLVEELETTAAELVRDSEAARKAPPSRMPLYLGGAVAAGVVVIGGALLIPRVIDREQQPQPTPQPTTTLVVGPQATVTSGPEPTAPRKDPTSRPATPVPPTAVPPTAVPPTAVPPTAVPATVAPPTVIPPTAAPKLSLKSAEPASRTLRLALGASQKFSANVGIGDPAALVWTVDDVERGRGGSFVLAGDDLRRPGSRTVAVEYRAGERVERLANWRVEVSAPTLSLTAIQPSGRSLTRQLGDGVELSARLRTEVDDVAYEWSVNGETVRGATSPRYSFRPTAPGSYTVTLRAVAPWGTAVDNSWSIRINAKATPAPRPTPTIEARRDDPQAELRAWITTYCGAFERKDTDLLLRLGHLKNREEAERLRDALAVMQDLRVSCTNPSISVDRNEATVSFDRTDRWTAGGKGIERELPRITKSLRRQGGGWVVAR